MEANEVIMQLVFKKPQSLGKEVESNEAIVAVLDKYLKYVDDKFASASMVHQRFLEENNESAVTIEEIFFALMTASFFEMLEVETVADLVDQAVNL